MASAAGRCLDPNDPGRDDSFLSDQSFELSPTDTTSLGTSMSKALKSLGLGSARREDPPSSNKEPKT